MSSLNKFRQKGQPSVNALLECIPDDGCILVFNGLHRNWRSKAADYDGMFTVSKLSHETLTRDDNTTTCDLIVSWRQ